jgi:hypothetical protein
MQDEDVALTRVENQTFTRAVVELDGKDFVACKFSGCTLVYAGGAIDWDDATDFGDSQFEFSGAADRTVRLLAALGGLSEEFQSILLPLQ